ncbi:MAG: CRISPR-associated protein Csx3 [Coleofasciculus sp. S288]|nr:CRISPR-associated protein Csx3 [Coleofasciculus sp. S288]
MSSEESAKRDCDVELQVIALRGRTCDYQALAINLLKPEICPKAMCELEMPAEIDWQQGVVLYGQASAWLYGHIVARCQHAPWVGCFDIRSHAAILVKSNVPEWQPGDTIPIIPNRVPGAAILIGGPPESGKSVLSHALRVGVLTKRADVQVYLHRANWDGEGNHTYETSDPKLVARLRKENNFKLHHHPNKDVLIGRYFEYHAKATENIRKVVDLALVDVGGVPEPVKTPVVEKCSHYIVISRYPDRVQEWHDLCGEKLKPLAVIHSVKEERLEVLQTEPFLEIVAGPWQRGEFQPVPDVLLQEVLKLLL